MAAIYGNRQQRPKQISSSIISGVANIGRQNHRSRVQPIIYPSGSRVINSGYLPINNQSNHYIISSRPQYYQQTQNYNLINTQQLQQPTASFMKPHYFNSQMLSTKVQYVLPKPPEDDFVVYCPVCNKDYFNSQVQIHMRKHYMADSYDFKKDDRDTSSRVTVDTSNKYQPAVMYPLIQPLQFYTNQLDEVSRQDHYKFILNQNYDRIKPQRVFQKKEDEVQTLTKPPLQFAIKNTNLYNCLDNAVNPSTFSVDDIWKNNQGIASKRQFNQWEHMIVSNKK